MRCGVCGVDRVQGLCGLGLKGCRDFGFMVLGIKGFGSTGIETIFWLPEFGAFWALGL